MSVDLVGSVLSAVLGGRKKRSRRSASFLGRRGGGLINAQTIMAAAGLVWGVYESWKAKQGGGGTADVSTPASPPSMTKAGVFDAPVVPPPIPPGADSALSAERTERLVRLAVAAANADGSMSAEERVAIAAQARAAGASDALVASLSRSAALADIVAGAADAREKASLYVLAFTIVRADEQVAESERAFLAELASALALDPMVVASLEASVGANIDAER